MPLDEQTVEFDEAWYLRSNPDVILKSAGGTFETGLHHYLAHGRAEGRRPIPPQPIEPVRLLIWDLDETFWDGTLTEGGISFRQDRLDIVIELARRGIVSSICSKNDHEAVKTVLIQHGAWDYFIFPSISWEAKGPRIARIIEDVQLRAPTVMFIDDNPLNLQEAKHFSPRLQVRSHTEIDGILVDPLFKGKADPELTRLAQYKTLEQRKSDEATVGNADAFLRSSDIRVRLEFDLLSNLDRVVELINRTNQLNFTKERLSENSDEAKQQLVSLLSKYSVQAALVHVIDRYGDHGFSGLYIHNSESRRLSHFCFSCRILGMGVEQWLYNKLGRPALDIVGEVLSDPKDTTRTVDWITQEDGPSADRKESKSASADLVIARGACDLGAVIHYFAATFPEAVGEYHEFRHGTVFRTDHSVFMRYAIEGISAEQLAVAGRLGYLRKDFESRIFERSAKRTAVLIGLHSDAHFPIYRHRETGLEVPMVIGDIPPFVNLCGPLPEDPDRKLNSQLGSAISLLKAEFEHLGPISETDFKANLYLTLNRIPMSTKVFLLKIYTNDIVKNGDIMKPHPRFQIINRWIEETCIHFMNVIRLNMQDYIVDDNDVIDHLHFSRMVFFRIYQDVMHRLKGA